jgi:hypothetical protein
MASLCTQTVRRPRTRNELVTNQAGNTSVQTAARRQIIAAIEHVRKSELEAAITLGLAAEGMLPKTEKEHLFPKVKALGKSLEGVEDGAVGPNDVGIWLKHGTYQGKPCESAVISDLEAFVAIERAISKFAANYGGISKEMGDFVDWAIKRFGDKPREPS